jgi:hypothetical protein
MMLDLRLFEKTDKCLQFRGKKTFLMINFSKVLGGAEKLQLLYTAAKIDHCYENAKIGGFNCPFPSNAIQFD